MLAGTSGHEKPQPPPRSDKPAAASAAGNGVWHSAAPKSVTADFHQVKPPVAVDDLSEPASEPPVPGGMETLESIGAAPRREGKLMPPATNAEGEAAAKRIAEAVAMARVQVEMRALARAKAAADASAKAAADLHKMADDLSQMGPQSAATAAADSAAQAQTYEAVKRASADAQASSDRVTAEATRAVAQAAADVEASSDPTCQPAPRPPGLG